MPDTVIWAPFVMITLSLFIIAAVGLLITRRILARWAASMLLLALYVISAGALNPSIMQSSEISSGDAQWKDSNLIVLLGVGIDVQSGQAVVPTFALPRLLRAVEAYRECNQGDRQCTLIISGGVTSSVESSEAEVYQDRILRAAPDMQPHIKLESKSRNTWENAKNTSGWALDHGYSNIWLVTSLLHIRRSEVYFNHFGVSVNPLPSEQSLPSPSWLPSAWNLLMVDIFVHEQIGLLRYALYEQMGWNSK